MESRETFVSVATAHADRLSAALGPEAHAAFVADAAGILRHVGGEQETMERLALEASARPSGLVRRLVDTALAGESATVRSRRDTVAVGVVRTAGEVFGVVGVALANASDADPAALVAALAALVEQELALYAGVADPITYRPTDASVELRRSSEALERSNKELRDIKFALDQSAIVAITDTSGRITYANDKFCEISKYGRGELLGQDHRIINSGLHEKAFIRDLWTTIANGDVWRGELRNRAKDGSFYWVDTTIVPLLDARGKPAQYVAIRSDITKRKEAEEELRDSEERYREQATLLDNAHDAIMLRDLDQRIIYMNKGAERLYGWSRDEVIGRDAREVLYGGDAARFRDALATLMEVGDWLGELRQYTKNGDEVLVQSHWTLIRDRDGRPKSMLAINTDVTERKRIELQFLRAQRMESIGTLASGIAHDLNNILSPILTSIQLLQMRIRDEQTAPLLDALAESAQRGADLVRQVLSFARGATGEKMSLQPRHVIRDVLKILRETLPRSIQVEYRLPTDLWPVLGDPTQLHQVLMNLCVNARDAMPHGGRLMVSARNVTIDENYARMHLDARPGRFVRVSVADTGTGIAPDILDKIFEPFFTTKEQGKGTGLGLSTVVGIVKGHGGFINAYSEVGRGTEFTLHFPTADVEELREEETPVDRLPRGQGELVLVVDDEPAIRDVTSSTLEAFGYRTAIASDGTEAVALVAAHQGSVRAVVLDMMMPIMDGPMTIRALRKLDPNVPILATSGLAANERVREASIEGIGAFLSKPYTAEQLLVALAGLLHADA